MAAPADPFDAIAAAIDDDALPMLVYRGPVAGAGSPPVLAYDCPILEHLDRPYRRGNLFIVVPDDGVDVDLVPAHECADGALHPGRPAGEIVGASRWSVPNALEVAARQMGLSE